MSCERVTRTKLADNISNLPDNVIDIILSRLPLRDAGRTSVLSTKWRVHWTRIESLVFDRRFYKTVFHDGFCYGELNDEYKFAAVASLILLSHVGPIRKLVFEFPVNTLLPGAISGWIRSAAQCGLQDLMVSYEYDRHGVRHQCPSSVFQCTDLIHLSLKYVNLGYPPCNFRNLHLLCSLDLFSVDIPGDMLTNIFLSCPLLECFWFDSYMIDYDDDPFVIEAPKLNLLSVTYYNCPTFILKNISNVSSLSLKADGYEIIEDVNTFKDIVSFFGDVPNVEDINVNGNVLVQWHERAIPERLPAPLKNHRKFIIHDLDMYCPRQIHSLLCLIKSSPNLKTLHISLNSVLESRDTWDYLRSEVTKVQYVWSLKSVRITGLMGKKREMLIIQLILSCSPMLETLWFGGERNISSAVEFKMMTSIMRFRRASSHAELIYLKHE